MCKQWLVAYTKPRHEKRAAETLQCSGFDAFLPLTKVLRSWSDRKKWVEAPMFPGYLFINVESSKVLPALCTHGIVRIVSFERQPARVPDKVIEAIKAISGKKYHSVADSDSDAFVLGDEVQVKTGPLKGICGRLVDLRGKYRLALEIECMQKTVLVEVNKIHLN